MIELISFALFVLLIILCISIYQMTKDVAEIKNHIVFGSSTGSDLQYTSNLVPIVRKNLILGNKDELRKILLNKFMDDVRSENSNASEYADYQKSIEHHVTLLQKRFEFIGEQVPAFILNLKTYNDFINLVPKDLFSKSYVG